MSTRMSLSAQQIAQYRRDGYVCPVPVMPAAEALIRACSIPWQLIGPDLLCWSTIFWIKDAGSKSFLAPGHTTPIGPLLADGAG